MVELRKSLKFKVGIYLVIALSVAVFLFTLLVVRNYRDELLQQVVAHSAQLSEVVLKSTRFAMHQNKPSEVNQIIRNVGALQDLEASQFWSTLLSPSISSMNRTPRSASRRATKHCQANPSVEPASKPYSSNVD